MTQPIVGEASSLCPWLRGKAVVGATSRCAPAKKAQDVGGTAPSVSFVLKCYSFALTSDGIAEGGDPPKFANKSRAKRERFAYYLVRFSLGRGKDASPTTSRNRRSFEAKPRFIRFRCFILKKHGSRFRSSRYLDALLEEIAIVLSLIASIAVKD